MERYLINKENKPVNSISNIFKVKKCLFDRSLQKESIEPSSPYSVEECQMSSPMAAVLAPEDSPYSLFKVKKKRSVLRSKVTNADFSPYGTIVTTPTNKRFIDKKVEKKEENYDSFQSPNNVKLAVQKSILNPNLIGDFTKPCTLPTIRGRHPDLKTVLPQTVATLLQGSESISYSLIDCRYPYEFQAGHIKTALNIYVKQDIVSSLLSKSITTVKKESTQALIFYCEFSSERGPSMLRYLRSIDRDLNKDCYPFLYYPELYVLEGGYKEFYSAYKELCDPQQYKGMLDKDSAEEFIYYRSKCKSSGRRSICAKRARSSLVF